MEPTERPNSTAPISAVETDKMSRMAGVRVAHDAINSPGMKKKVKAPRAGVLAHYDVR
jgi:hypothetical protein